METNNTNTKTIENTNNQQIDLTGTISHELKNKHRLSPNVTDQEISKKIRDDTLNNTDQTQTPSNALKEILEKAPSSISMQNIKITKNQTSNQNDAKNTN